MCHREWARDTFFIRGIKPMRGVKGICTLVCLLMLAGCGNKENPGGSGSGFNLPNIKTEAETETETEEVTTEAASTTEEVTEAATEETVAAAFSEEDNYFSPEKALVISKKDMMNYLDGSWELLPNGQPIMAPDVIPDTFTFDAETQEATFTRGSDSEYITFDFELEDLFESIAGTCNLMRLTGKDISGAFSQYSDNMISAYVTYQVILVSDTNADMLLLREIGNGEAQFSYDGLSYDRTAFDGFWVFRSLNDESKMKRVNNIDDQIRLKNSTFYAIAWYDMGDRVSLQRILINPEVLNLYGEDQDVLSYCLPNNEYALSSVTYFVKDMEDMANSGEYVPRFCQVKTDENGDVIELRSLVYDIFGYYYPAGVYPNNDPDGGDYSDPTGPDGAGPDARDPEYYRDTDNIYMGMWELKGDPMTTLTVVMDSPQVGGYELCFDFYRLTYAHCYANISGSDLSTNQGTINNDRDFGGVLTQTEDGVKFTVTESGFEAIGVGTEYEFIRPY